MIARLVKSKPNPYVLVPKFIAPVVKLDPMFMLPEVQVEPKVILFVDNNGSILFVFKPPVFVVAPEIPNVPVTIVAPVIANVPEDIFN